MLSARTTCVLADDHPGILEVLGGLLTAHGFDVMETATDGESALSAITRLQPDVAVVDVGMPRLSGIDVTRRLRVEGSRTQIVVYSAHGDSGLVTEALDAGVSGYVLKEAPLTDVVRALGMINGGATYVDPVLAGRIATSSLRPPPVSLSAREREVLRLLADGRANDEIGEQLEIAPDTVRTYITNAMSKLGAVTRTQAVARALRQSLI